MYIYIYIMIHWYDPLIASIRFHKYDLPCNHQQSVFFQPLHSLPGLNTLLSVCEVMQHPVPWPRNWGKIRWQVHHQTKIWGFTPSNMEVNQQIWALRTPNLAKSYQIVLFLEKFKGGLPRFFQSYRWKGVYIEPCQGRIT